MAITAPHRTLQLSESIPPWRTRCRYPLRAALINLLNNAADASPDGIEIFARCDASQFILSVIDHGPGLSDEVARLAGSAFFTTKDQGRGLGLFLANATIEHLGGTVRLSNSLDGGATTELTLPLSSART